MHVPPERPDSGLRPPPFHSRPRECVQILDVVLRLTPSLPPFTQRTRESVQILDVVLRLADGARWTRTDLWADPEERGGAERMLAGLPDAPCLHLAPTAHFFNVLVESLCCAGARALPTIGSDRRCPACHRIGSTLSCVPSDRIRVVPSTIGRG
eukprot:1193550-Prorocentrum_minimum.AAC.3